MKILLYIAGLLTFSLSLSAQEKDWGRVSASIESQNHVYVDDAANNFYPSDQIYLDGSRYATNNYVKVDYYKGRLSSGLQLEGYFPTTIGYPMAQNKLSLSNLYVSWTDDDYSVTAGTFYEQLGSGLLFRSWEDRALGLNSALAGARGTYTYGDMLSVRAFAGVPRLDKILNPTDRNFFGLGLSKTLVAAGDVAFSLSDALGWNDFSLGLEASVLYKYEKFDDYLKDHGFNDSNIGWSARVNAETNGFYLKGEYVDAGRQFVNTFVDAARGDAQLIELGYPVVVAVNMIDAVEKKGDKIKRVKRSRRLKQTNRAHHKDVPDLFYDRR